ncbi:MOSC domain-containing protein [Isoptericola sp. NPDC056573]|uniref:MOSC domain-containing protein n=1 Tax=Isoptericola sp. NPDC056573 TaxID=3345868 RepID=UPI0036A10046
MTVTDPATAATTSTRPAAGRVDAVHASRDHGFSKPTVDRVVLVEGVGVEGDAHAGVTVQHRSRVAADPSQPNLRQVHLIHGELFDRLAAAGHAVAPGDLGENVTTRGIDLLALPVGTRLTIGAAVVTVTGLRNPCRQIDDFQPGLLKQVLHRGADGGVERLAGVMGIVSRGGTVRPGDAIGVELPAPPHLPLTRV